MENMYVLYKILRLKLPNSLVINELLHKYQIVEEIVILDVINRKLRMLHNNNVSKVVAIWLYIVLFARFKVLNLRSALV